MSCASPDDAAHAVRVAAARLRAAGIDHPRLEARLMIAHAIGRTVADLVRDPGQTVDPALYGPLVERRAAHEPLAYILGHREFWSLDFAVSPATLIPRPESEMLIEAAVAAFAQEKPSRILDLGTGTGCLLLAALHEFPGAFGVGVDRSLEAALLAARNATALGLAERAAFLCADWAAPLDGRFDLVLCNPPYIPTCEIEYLMPDVERYEPRAALDGGADGLVSYRHLIDILPSLLTTQGVAVVELGAGQMPAVTRIAEERGLSATARDDLAGIPRAMVVRPAVAKKSFGTQASAV